MPLSLACPASLLFQGVYPIFLEVGDQFILLRTSMLLQCFASIFVIWFMDFP